MLTRMRRLHPRIVPLAAAACSLAVYTRVLRPRMLGWGAGPSEVAEAPPHPRSGTSRSTRAITIAAPPEEVWPWLVQMGEERGGWYSHDRIERLLGAGRYREGRSADRIHADLQGLREGDLIPFSRAIAIRVTRLRDRELLTLGRGWSFVLRPCVTTAGIRGTRLVVHTDTAGLLDPRGSARRDGSPCGRGLPRGAALLVALLVEPLHHVMEGAMLRGIRDRAEGRPARPRLAARPPGA